MHSTRPVSHGSKVALHAMVAAVLALGLVLAIAASSWAAPVVSIDVGPPAQTRETLPSFDFAVDASALTVDCSLDQGTEAYAPCTSPYLAASSLEDGDWTFRVRASDGVDETVETWSFTVDTLDPRVNVISGPDGPTNDATPSFAFTVDDATATSVECAVDQEAYAPCTSATTHDVGTSLLPGPHTFQVRATDAAGNDAETAQAFVVDLVDPDVDVTSGPEGPTRETAPSFEFTAEPGARLDCSIDRGSPAYVPCTSPYRPATPLSDGSFTFQVQATDAAGNVAVATRSFSVDTARPSLSIGSGPSAPTRDVTPSFGFTVADASATGVECSIDRGTPVYGACTTTTSHTASSLSDGDYVFHVRATDAVGNHTERSRAFSVDTVAPEVHLVSGPAGATNNRSPSFGFTEVDASAMRVECSIDHGTPSYALCTSPYTPPAPLSDGDYVFHVRATDAVGYQTEREQEFSVDSAAPSLSIDPGMTASTNDTTPSFGFTTDAPTAECSIDHGTPSYVLCTSPYTPAAPLGEGSYFLHVRATDGVGNTAETFRGFTVDTTPPSLTIDSGPSGTTSDPTPLFQFTAEAGSTVECSIDQGAPAYAPCTSARAHATVAPLADGAYTFSVRATDRAGNQTVVSRTFTVDTVPDAPGPGSPRTDPTPPVTPPITTPVTPTPTRPQLLSPFPLVRISGTLTSNGARIRLLTVRASPGTLVRVTVSPACRSGRRSSRRCRVVQAAGTVGRRSVIGFRVLEHAYRSGTVIVVRVWRADRIGKYTRFTIVRGKAPRRVDQCLVPEATSGSRCPTG